MLYDQNQHLSILALLCMFPSSHALDFWNLESLVHVASLNHDRVLVIDYVSMPQVLDADSVQYGSACARMRQFIVMKHRFKVLAELSPASRFLRRFHRAVCYSWREHFFMNTPIVDGVIKNEAEVELRWAMRRPTSLAHSMCEEPVDIRDPKAFLNALTETETMYLQSYKAQHPNQCYSLNQDPDSGHGSCSTDWSLQTVIHNCHLMFCDSMEQPRWMFGTEVLSCLGQVHKNASLSNC